MFEDDQRVVAPNSETVIAGNKRASKNSGGEIVVTVAEENTIDIRRKKGRRRIRFDGMSQEEIEKKRLPDRLENNLDVVFVGKCCLTAFALKHAKIST